MLIPLRIVRRGYRVRVRAGGARLRLRRRRRRAQEFVRKARTIAGTFQLFARERWLLNPLQQPPLVRDDVAQGAAAGAAGAARGAARRERRAGRCLDSTDGCSRGQVVLLRRRAGWVRPSARRGGARLSSRCPARCACCSWATVVGFVRFVTNRQQVTWERVPAPASRRDVAA